jgi:pyruvate/2-oxoglutarate dehydrogenase complex dihydrolipoamide dehydrogenase (E3) component
MEGRTIGGKCIERGCLSKKIQIEVPDELFEQLMRVAEAMGISNPEEAATVGLAEWVSRRKSELDDRDPNEKYEVNEALDELLEKKR